MLKTKIIRSTPQEDREITTAALSDPDALPITDDDIATGKLKLVRGPQKAPTKEQITLRIDKDVVDSFRVEGKGWQTRLNAKLREALGL